MLVIIAILTLGYVISNLISWLNLRHLKDNIDSPLPPSIASQFDGFQRKQVADYIAAKTRFGYWKNLIGVGVIIVILVSGLIGGLARLIYTFGLPPMIQGLLVMFLLMLIGYLTDVPASLYFDFVLEKKFGFSTITARIWLGDQMKSLLVSGLLMGLLFVGFYLFINWFGGWWWLPAWGLFVSFSILLLFLAPAVIMPMFNKFVPLEDEALRKKIMDMAQKAEFPLAGVFQMDASKRSTHDNAFFAGLAKTRRIVFFDTMIRNYSHEELLAVMGHEIGHWKLRHTLKIIVITSVLSVLMLYLISLLMAHPWIYQAMRLGGLFENIGFNGVLIGPALYMAMILFEPLSLLISPLLNKVSRSYEYQSDAFSFKLNGSGEPLKEALIKLSKKSLSNLFPHPIYVFFHYSHPPLLARLKAIDDLTLGPSPN
jgi:STE24 endopeptidase